MAAVSFTSMCIVAIYIGRISYIFGLVDIMFFIPLYLSRSRPLDLRRRSRSSLHQIISPDSSYHFAAPRNIGNSTHMPHINPHSRRPTPLQYTHTDHIVQPRIRAVPSRLKLAAQHRPSIRERETLCYNHDARPVMCANRVPRIGSKGAFGIGQTPVCADVEDGS